jgi:hypothetical protein
VIPGSYEIDVEFDNASRGDYLTGMLFEPQPLVVGDAVPPALRCVFRVMFR